MNSSTNRLVFLSHAVQVLGNLHDALPKEERKSGEHPFTSAKNDALDELYAYILSAEFD